MGSGSSRSSRFLSSCKSTRLLVLGLDAAGKSTFLYSLHPTDVETTIIAIGFYIETVKHEGQVTLQSWDIGGNPIRKELTRPFFEAARGLIFLVDSRDRERIDSVRIELFIVLEHEGLGDGPVLILANKQDLPGAMSVEEVKEILQLDTIRGRNWRIVGTSVIRWEGVSEGLEWMTTALERKKSQGTL